MRVKLAAAVAALTLVSATPAAAKVHLQFHGQAIVPTGTTFAGTTVGGLSSITYDRAHDVYYALSDDPSQFQPVRYYTVGLAVHDGQLTDGDVSLQGVTTMLAPNGLPYAPFSLDPEGLALTQDRELIFTSEGVANNLIDPFIRRYSLGGTFLSSLPVPDDFLPNAAHTRGVRQNLGFESAGVTGDGRYLFSATENALVQDGPAATVSTGSPSRLMRYDLRSDTLDRQWFYETDPVAQEPVPPTQFSVNGVVEVLPLSDHKLIVMERSFSVGVPGTGNRIKLYEVTLPGGPDLRRPVHKKLVFDLDDLGIPLDNVEGLTFGPRLSDGRRTVVLVSDNNFAATQFTQFLLFTLKH